MLQRTERTTLRRDEAEAYQVVSTNGHNRAAKGEWTCSVHLRCLYKLLVKSKQTVQATQFFSQSVDVLQTGCPRMQIYVRKAWDFQ